MFSEEELAADEVRAQAEKEFELQQVSAHSTGRLLTTFLAGPLALRNGDAALWWGCSC